MRASFDFLLDRGRLGLMTLNRSAHGLIISIEIWGLGRGSHLPGLARHAGVLEVLGRGATSGLAPGTGRATT